MKREYSLERSLPSDELAEQTILAAILLDNTLITQALERLVPNDFYSPLHRRIYTAMLDLFAAGSKIDPITINDHFKKDGSSESLGGITTITNLTHGIPHFTDITQYIDLVSTHSRARKLVKICNLTSGNILSEGEEFVDVLDQHEQLVHELRNRDAKNEFARIGTLATQTVKQIRKFSQDPTNGLLGISTGYKDIDARTSGLENDDLIILAARPSMGKTALALQIAQRAAVSRNAVVAVFSLEMSKHQLTQRMIASEARVDLMRLRRGYLGREEWLRVEHAEQQLQTPNLYIDDTPGLSAMEIRAKSRRIQTEQGSLDLVVIDHLGLIREADHRASRHLQLSGITKSLKAMAKTMHLPVVALHQLSREVEKRKPPIPIMSDLRESGAIEEDADLVMFIYREDYYNRDQEPTNIAEIIFGKNRNGPTGSDKLIFRKEFALFEDAVRGSF